jgi:hypothetical protein
MRAAAQSFDRSKSPTVARYADHAADRVERFSRSLHEQRWGDIIDDVEDVARRRPALFILGTVAVGFLVGRLLSAPITGEHAPRTTAAGALSPDEAVKAAISSASGDGVPAREVHEGSAPRESR